MLIKGPANTAAVILAGGFGTRIRELYPDVPKPMIEVCGRPFIEWVIRYLAAEGIRDFSVSAGYKADVIKNYLKSRPCDGLKFHFVIEEEPLGTAGGFLHAADALRGKEHILAANGDSLVLSDLGPAFDALHEKSPDAVIVGVEVEDCSRYGSLEVDENGFLIGFREKQKRTGLINAGIYIFHERTLRAFPAKKPLSFEYDVFPGLLKDGKKVAVIGTAAPFIDIGTPDTVKEAARFIEENSSGNYFFYGG